MQVLREVSPKNDERAVSLLIERTRDVMLEVVVGALDSLQEICERGHRVCRVVVDNVLPLLEHEGSVVSPNIFLLRAHPLFPTVLFRKVYICSLRGP